VTDRERYTASITKLHALKQEIGAVLVNARGAGDVYVHLSACVDGLQKEVERLDKKAVRAALEMETARPINHKVFCADRYGEPCNCGAMQ
jgi:hypothetical protein